MTHSYTISAVSSCQPTWAQEVINFYQTDDAASDLLARLAIHSPDDNGYFLSNGLIRVKDRLWISNNSALQTKLISALHSSAVGGHSGVRATYQRVSMMFLLC